MTWATPASTINGTNDERMHEVYLCGLEPATTYYYRVGGGAPGSEAWSEIYSFTTTPSDPAAPVTFGVTGDSRGQKGDAWRLIQRRLKVAGVGMQLFSGDAVLLAPDQADWEHWLDSAWKDTDGSPLTLPSILSLTAHGNHENHRPSSSETSPSRRTSPGTGNTPSSSSRSTSDRCTSSSSTTPTS